MKKNWVVWGLALLAFLACNQKEDKPAADAVKKTAAAKSKLPEEWKGSYKTILPCADCKGVENLLVLHEDATYELRQIYLEDKEERFNKLEGKIIWQPNTGSIKLEGVSNLPAIWNLEGKSLTESGAGKADKKIVFEKIN